MKSLLIVLVTFVSINLSAQTEVDFLNAVGKKDLSNVGSYLASNVSFCINDNQKKVSKATAISELEKFLSSKKIQKFKILHNGKSSDKASSYRVARIKTQDGTYRIFAYSEGVGQASRVVEIRIDPM
jgi:hypothetical protein